MRRMKKARQYLLGIFAALLLCGVFSVNTVKAESQHIYDNASLLSDAEEQDLERSCAEFENNTDIHMVILTERSSGSEDCQAIADDFYDKKYPKGAKRCLLPHRYGTAPDCDFDIWYYAVLHVRRGNR